MIKNKTKKLFLLILDGIVSDVKLFTPFIYIDVSDSSTLTLYIQPLPQRLNVSTYKAWMINSVTKSSVEVTLKYQSDQQTINYNFTVDDGEIIFKVAALHPSCQNYGCVNSTSPPITISKYLNNLLNRFLNHTVQKLMFRLIF